jgi:hypothetical protein
VYVSPYFITASAAFLLPQSFLPAVTSPASGPLRRWRRLQPADYFFCVFVRRKDRIEHVLDTPVLEHECQPLQYAFTGDLEGREAETTGEFEVVITLRRVP